MKIVDIYTDGSFNGIATSWAFAIIKENEIIYKENGRFPDNDPINEMYQVGGEIQAVIEAVKYCKQNQLKAIINYDLIHLYKWVADFFGEKPWKRNKKWSQEYRDFIEDNKDFIERFNKVKGHSKIFGNDVADKLAKEA